MVVVDRELEPAKTPDAGRRIISTTYHVLAQEKFLNGRDRLTASVPFYTQVCEITLQGSDGHRQFWPMVSDDGKSLVLVAVTPPVPRETVLSLYRCDSVFGELVRNFELTDLATAQQARTVASGRFMITDATPQWFAGGTFTFSTQGNFLIYRNSDDHTYQIRLGDGALTKSDPRFPLP